MDQEKGFFEGCEEKKTFWTIKRIGSKKPPKFAFFSKALVRGFCQKNGDFLIFSFYAKWFKRKCFFEGFERKEAFLDHKNIDSISTKI